MLGNIKFIGELYRLGILHESIMHKCIKQLINKKKKGSIADMAEDLECLSQIMTTCGKRLDHPKAKSLMDQYFERMQVLRKKHSDLPSRICFMLQDVVELRENHWVPRNAKRDNGPKTLSQIRHEVEELYLPQNGEMYGGHRDMPPRHRQTGPGFSGNSRYDMPYPATTARNGPPQMPQQYSGSFPGTSPPPPLNSNSTRKNESAHDFDFFGPVKPRPTMPGNVPSKQQPTRPSGLPSNQPPTRPMYQASMPPDQRHSPVFNGYNTPPPQRGFPVHEPPRNATNGQDFNAKQPQKPEHKLGKELPPRFQRQKQQSKEQPRVRNGDGHKKSPVFTSLNSSPDVEHPPAKQVAPQVNRGTPLGNAKHGKGAPNQRRSHPADVAPRRGVPTNRHPSPTIHQQNIDAIQAPFQHAIDNASQRPPVGKTNSTAAVEKIKGKKTSLSKADVEGVSEEIVEKYFGRTWSEEQSVNEILDLKIQKKHMPTFICKVLEVSMTKSDAEKDKMAKLLHLMIEKKACSSHHVQEGTRELLDKLVESDVQSAASVITQLIISGLLTLAEVGDLLLGGVHFPLFMLTLKQMSKVKGENYTQTTFNNSKIDFMKMLPELSQSKAFMVSILEEMEVQYLFPLVHIESKLANQIASNPNPGSVYKWMKENVNSELFSDPSFIKVLVYCCLDHVTKSSSLGTGIDLTQNLPKELKEKERELLENIKPLLQKFLHESQKLQLHALYAVQVFCCEKSFPKGLLLRLFNSMYELDVIDEETYFIWKEDVNPAYDGKGKALFQVNTWLTWLNEAETEDEEEN